MTDERPKEPKPRVEWWEGIVRGDTDRLSHQCETPTYHTPVDFKLSVWNRLVMWWRRFRGK